MDFNDIQNAWNNDEPKDIIVPNNLEKIKTANMPLEKIRLNLKKEFLYQFVSIAFLGILPLFYDFHPRTTMLYYLLYILFIAVCTYYLLKLYVFYKRLNTTTLTTKDNLYETYFDIRIHMELYKTFGFATTPFLVLYLVGFYYYSLSKNTIFIDHEFSNGQIAGIFVTIFFTVLCMGISLEWWVRKFYGKYAEEIKKVIDELRED